MASPCCPKCENATSISWQTKTLNGIEGMLIYCSSCGAIITWVPKPKK